MAEVGASGLNRVRQFAPAYVGTSPYSVSSVRLALYVTPVT